MPDSPLIEAHQLCLRYGAKPAVDKVSFSVARGSVTGFLGPNGAGKSTTMRLLAGYRTPSSGTVRICGHDMLKERRLAQAKTGYLPEAAGGMGHLQINEFLRYCCAARGLSQTASREAIERVGTQLELMPLMHSAINRLSKGWRQRVWLAQALIHDPEVLILDEPTDGLDPNQKRAIKQLIRELSLNRSILFSTHVLEEAEAMCDHVIIINRGQLVADQPIAGLLDDNNSLAPAFYDLTP